MPTTEPIMQPISAPILVPGTQQAPTTPSSNGTSSGSSSDIGTSSNPNHNSNNYTGRTSTSSARVSTSHHSHSHSQGGGSFGNGSSNNNNNHNNNNNNNNNNVRRFPSIGNTKKLSIENQTLRAKIAELERYLTGLKEELILANRQIHARNLEIKLVQERKAVELHELTQQIQRAEFDLVAKTADVETLQNQLQHQAKEQMSKIKHIDMLQTEIQDYKRMSVTSGGTTPSTAFAPGTSGSSRNSMQATTPAAAVEDQEAKKNEKEMEGTVAVEKTPETGDIKENSNKEEEGEEVKTKGRLESLQSAETPSLAEENRSQNPDQNQEALSSLKDENKHKDEIIKDLKAKLDELTASINAMKQEMSRPGATVKDSSEVPATEQQHGREATVSVSGSNSAQTFHSTGSSYTSVHTPLSSLSQGNLPSLVNSVGYDISVEHPKLLARYQALRFQHAQASEYVEALESENHELKVQLLDVSSIDLMSGPLPVAEGRMVAQEAV